MKKLILWDFDGVIADSIDECLITSYNAYINNEKNDNNFIRNVSDVPLEQQAFFYKNRKYVRPPGEYFIIHYAFDNHISLDNYKVFKNILDNNSEIVKEYQNLFFLNRKELKKYNQKNWLKYHKIYDNIVNNWVNLKNLFNYFIVSNKDTSSILSIMENFNLDIDKKNVYGADFSSSKRKIIRHILHTVNIKANNVIFIDDNHHHLLDVSDLGIKLCYANWGYGENPPNLDDKIINLELHNFHKKLLEML